MPFNLSLNEAKDLLENRVKFKLYAAENHLNNLKALDQNNITGILSFEGRLIREIEIECFLFHIIGAKDSLLIRLNDKLRLGIDIEKAKLRLYKEVNKALKRTGKGSLLVDMNDAFRNSRSNKPAGWLWVLNNIRAQSAHKNLLKIQVSHKISENVNTGNSSSDEPKVFFVSDPEKRLQIIPFLENSLQNMKDLVESIENKEPLLN